MDDGIRCGRDNSTVPACMSTALYQVHMDDDNQQGHLARQAVTRSGWSDQLPRVRYVGDRLHRPGCSDCDISAEFAVSSPATAVSGPSSQLRRAFSPLWLILCQIDEGHRQKLTETYRHLYIAQSIHTFQNILCMHTIFLTLWRPQLPYGYRYLNHFVPDRVKRSFVIFDIWALWGSS